MLHRIISGQVYQHPYDRLMDEPTYTRNLAILTKRFTLYAYFGNGGDRYDSLIFVNILAIDIAFDVLEALHSSHGPLVLNVDVISVSLTLFLTRFNGLQKGEINGENTRQ